MAVVRGEAADAQSVPVPQVCVGIFTDVDHKLIASTETDESGGFHFDGIPGGSYRLVASYDGFSVANAKVRVEPKVNQKKRLALHMRFAGIDSTSFFELK